MRRLLDYLALVVLRKIAIRTRLIGAFAVLALLPLLIGGTIWYKASTQAIAERTRVFGTEMVKQVAKNLRMEMAKMESESERLVLSDRVQDALQRYGSQSEAEQAGARAELTRALLERYGAVDYVNEKYFLDADNRILDSQVFATLGRSVVSFVVHAPKLHGRPYWATYGGAGAQTSIVLLRSIYSKRSNRLAGSLFLGVRPSQFGAVFDDVALGPGSELLVLDARSGKSVVTGAGQAGGDDVAADPALLDALRSGMLGNRLTGFTPYRSAAGLPLLAAYAQVAGTDWFVVNTIPQAALTVEAQAARNQVLLVGLFCFAVSLLLAALISHSIDQPLHALLESMREAEAGNFTRRMQAAGHDDLTVLAEKFNAMAARVDHDNGRLEAHVDARTRDLAEANAKLESLSMTDAVTGIANRRRFGAALATEFARAGRAPVPLALLVCDVDQFDAYRERVGPAEADASLRRIARLLQSHARRPGDLAARYGDGRFALIASASDGAAARVLAEAVRASVAALQLAHERSPLGVLTLSIGVAVRLPGQLFDMAALQAIAEGAAARAAAQGRNQVVQGPLPDTH